jgi:outer membrane lipoprotein-sorting protein
MRKIAGVVGVVCVSGIIIFSVRGNKDEDAKMRDIVARAIKAHGGDNVEKFKGSVTKTKGKLLDLEYTTETSLQAPDRTRTVAESKLGKFVQVLNGDKGWVKFGDLGRDCVKEELDEMREQLNANLIAHLAVLTEREYKLSPLGEEKVDDRPAVGVHVEHKGFRDLNLYFDKESFLLLKMETRIKDPLRGGEEVAAETVYGGYKDVDGVMTAHRITIKYDGKAYIESEVTEVKYADKLEDIVFEKP